MYINSNSDKKLEGGINAMEGNSEYNDPTLNVRLLVEASEKKMEDMRQSEVKNLEKQMAIHFDYIDRLTEAEAKRIDAIRAVDTGAVAIASEKAAAQALVLANQVAASAETLRNLVSAQALTVDTQIQQVSQQWGDRIASLEKTQYENKGLYGVSAELPNRVKLLEEQKFENKGRSGLSVPLLMMISSCVTGIIVFIIQKLMG